MIQDFLLVVLIVAILLLIRHAQRLLWESRMALIAISGLQDTISQQIALQDLVNQRIDALERRLDGC